MTVIHKAAKDWKVDPNFVDYEGTRRGFDWSSAPDVCAGMGPGACNIAYAAVDRHQDGPAASRTALRFVSALDTDGAVATRDMSYGELGRLTRQFTNVLRSLAIGRGDRVFTLMGRTPGALHQHHGRAAQRKRCVTVVLGVRTGADRDPAQHRRV